MPRVWTKTVLPVLKRIYHRLYSLFCSLIGLVSYPLCRLLDIRFLNVFTERIGHLCVEPDCYLKTGILGLRPAMQGIIVADRERVANYHLLKYWKEHIRVMDSAVAHFFLRPLALNPFTRYDVSAYCATMNTAAQFPDIQRRYYEQPPILSLSSEDRRRGAEFLSSLGLGKGDWFVCIHCREEGYAPGEGQTYRNGDIETYMTAIRTVLDRGGWVVRMGDSSMKPLPPMERVIDYAHLHDRKDWMDVFLCASCRFFFGSSSGPSAMASVFGVPAGSVNHAPLSVVLPYGPDDVGIPKLLWSEKAGRFLTFKEIFRSPMGNFRYDHLYQREGVRAVENSAEDIRELVDEMLDRVEGRAVYTEEDERLQGCFKGLMTREHYSYGARSRVGRDFLRKYSALLDG